MRRLLALVAVAAVIAPACGLGEKEEFAEQVTAATALAIEAGTVKGTLTASMRIADAPVDVPAEATLDMSAAFVADLGSHRSVLTDQHLVHDDLVLHLRRADAEENDARPWLTLDLDDLNEDAKLPFTNNEPIRFPYTMFAIPPAVVIDLVAGALTGSLELLGPDEIDGVPVTGYRGNFDLEKTLTDTREEDYDDDRREAVERTFETLDIKESVHPGRVWLDAEGRPRRVEITFDMKPRNRWTFEMTLTLDLVEWGVDAPFDLPESQETIRISSITRLMTELGRAFPLPELTALPGQIPTQGEPDPGALTEQPAPEGLETEEDEGSVILGDEPTAEEPTEPTEPAAEEEAP